MIISKEILTQLQFFGYYEESTSVKVIELKLDKNNEKIVKIKNGNGESSHVLIKLSKKEHIDSLKLIVSEINNIVDLTGISFRYIENYYYPDTEPGTEGINYILNNIENKNIDIIDISDNIIGNEDLRGILSFSNLKILDVTECDFEQDMEKEKYGFFGFLENAIKASFFLDRLYVDMESLPDYAKAGLDKLVSENLFKNITDFQLSKDYAVCKSRFDNVNEEIIPKLVRKHFEVKRYLEESSKDTTNKLAQKLNKKYMLKLKEIYNKVHISIERCNKYITILDCDMKSQYILALYFYDLKKYNMVHALCISGSSYGSIDNEKLAALAITMIEDGYIESNKSEIDKILSVLWFACEAYKHSKSGSAFEIATQKLSFFLKMQMGEKDIDFSLSPERILIEAQMSKIQSFPGFEIEQGKEKPKLRP